MMAKHDHKTLVAGASAPVAGPLPRLTASYKRALRHTAELAIERLLSLLDDLDGDTDLEPSLGSSGTMNHFNWACNGGVNDDREEACEDEGAQCDDEGATEFEECGPAPFAMNQLGNRWFAGEVNVAQCRTLAGSETEMMLARGLPAHIVAAIRRNA